jgi:hypothetical protein
MSVRHRRKPFVTFAEETLGLEFTAPWRVLLRVAIDGVQPRQLEGEEREIARRLFGDVDEIHPRLRRVLVWRLGRSSGKTTVSAAICIYCAWTATLRSGPGHVPTAFIVAPGMRLAKIGKEVARELVRVSELNRYVQDDTADGFTMRRPDGRLVAVRSVAASKGGVNLRGIDVVVLVLDESEFFETSSDAADGYAVTDKDQLSAAMPRLLEYAILISTPWPTENATGELFDRNYGHPVDAVAALGASLFMRPTPQLEQDRAQELARDEETALREFDCVPGVRGGTRLFDVESIMAAVVEGRPMAIRAPAGACVGAGGDLAFEKDSSVIALASNLAGSYDLLEYEELRPTRATPLVPSTVIHGTFAPRMRAHGVRALMADGHYRMSVREHLAACGLEFLEMPGGAQGKYDLFMFTREILRSSKLRIPPAPRLIAQLKAVTKTPLPGAGGLTKISSPRRAGMAHGDIVSAMVCAIWSARRHYANAVPAGFFERARPRSNVFPGLGGIASGRGRGPAGGL